MPGEDGRELLRNISPLNHIISPGEGEVARPHDRTLYRLVNTEKVHISLNMLMTCLVKYGWKFGTYPSGERETRQRYFHSTYLLGECLRLVKDVKIGVNGPYLQWNARPLMIAGHYINRNSFFCDLEQGLHGELHERIMDPCPEEEITTMDDQVDVAVKRRTKRQFEVGEKIMPSSSSFDSRPERIIKSKMCIGDE